MASFPLTPPKIGIHHSRHIHGLLVTMFIAGTMCLAGYRRWGTCHSWLWLLGSLPPALKKTNIPLEQQQGLQSTSVFPLPIIQTAIARSDGQSQMLMPITRSALYTSARCSQLPAGSFLPARQHDGQLTVVLSLRQSKKKTWRVYQLPRRSQHSSTRQTNWQQNG